MLLTSSGVNSVVQLITILVIFVLVLVITLYVTRWIAGFQKNQMSGSNMTIVDTMRLTQNQVIQIVKIGEQYLAIAISKDQVTFLTKLDESEIHVDTAKGEAADFSTIFKRVKSSLPLKGDEGTEASNKDE